MKATKTILLNEFRAEAYKLLSDCYHQPDDDLFEKIKTFAKLDAGQVLDFSRCIDDAFDRESIKVDYAQLFVGPFKLLAAPYGSVYFEGKGLVMGDTTVDVRNIYRQENLFMKLKDAPDHIAIELEFMYFLIFREIQAKKNNDSNKVNDYCQKQKYFLNKHLSGWVFAFTDVVEKSADTSFYKNLAKITRAFIEADCNCIN